MTNEIWIAYYVTLLQVKQNSNKRKSLESFERFVLGSINSSWNHPEDYYLFAWDECLYDFWQKDLSVLSFLTAQPFLTVRKHYF